MGQASQRNGLLPQKQAITYILSATAGSVKAGEYGSCGKMAAVACSESITVYYAHLDSINVTKGERIDRGQIIGEAGSSGNATGPHLHFEVRYKGESRNPAQFIDKIGAM